MIKSFLYVARSTTDQKAIRNHVYKVGISTNPSARIRTLGSSGSTETYESIVELPLPFLVKDTHILVHRMIREYVLYSNVELQSKYTEIFGQEHLGGLKRRREIVMFGHTFSVTKVKNLFRRVMTDINPAKDDLYVCRDVSCVSSQRCDVCTKFIKSLWNSIAYQKTSLYRDPLSSFSPTQTRKRKLDLLTKVESKFVRMMNERRPSVSSANNRKRRRRGERIWNGPDVNGYWLLRPSSSMIKKGHRFLIGKVKSNDTELRSSRIQWWSPSVNADAGQMTESTFFQDTKDGTHFSDLDEIAWDNGGWQQCIRMTGGKHRKAKQIWKIDRPTILDCIQQWTSRRYVIRRMNI
jgi:hypothetical protein